MASYDDRLRHRLELQAMQIEQLMSRHGVHVEVEGGTVADGGINIDARTLIAFGRDRLRVAARELTRVFGVDQVDLERRDGRLRIRYRKRPRNAVDLLALMELVPDNMVLSVPLGIDYDARPLLLRLDDPEGGNVLIAGGENAGKTALLRAIVAGIALRIKQSDVQLLAISGTGFQSGRSRYSLAPLEHFPHFAAPVLESHEDAVEALDWMVQEAAYRERHGVKRPLLVLVIDDLDALLSFNDDAPLDLLRQLLDSRAAAGVRVVMCARDVLSPEVRGLLRHNVDLRLVGRLPGERDSRAATGIPDAGTDRLPGKGAFVAVSGGEAIRFQAAFIDDYDLHLAIEMAYGRSRGALLAQPLRAAAPTLPEEDSAGKDISFRIQNGSGRAVLDSTDEEAAMYASNAAGSAEEAEAVEEELPSSGMDWEADDDVENWVEDSDEASDYSWDES